MKIKKLTVLGKSDTVITMILDNLESTSDFYEIDIINNLDLPVGHDFTNNKFEINIKKEVSFFDNFFLGITNPIFKRQVFELFNFRIMNFLNIINKNTSISSTSEIGKGCLINSMVSIASKTIVGNFVTVNRNSSIGHHTKINDFVNINPGVNIAGHCEIGEGSVVGMGVNIIDGISIGKNTIIGAGSLVTKNLPDNVMAYGSPCKIIKNV